MISQKSLKSKFHYCPETGIFTSHIVTDKRGRKWGGREIGCVNSRDRDKYRYISIGNRANQKKYPAHRLAWLYVYGEWPTDQIDHINGNKLDNRIVNLREADHKLNSENIYKPQSNNKSGYRGVIFFKRDNNYQAQITTNKKRIHLGYFKTAQEAHEAYLNAKFILHKGFIKSPHN
jgi:hypothetical protein